MTGKAIATIYFYLISTGAIVLLVVATFSWANLILNLTQYDQYPLRYTVSGNCEGYPYKGMPYAVDMVQTPAALSAEEKAKIKEDCLKAEELDRKLHKVEDVKNAIAYTVVGIILFGIHFPMARKQSRN